MSADAAVDVLGRPRTKDCPGCDAAIGRTARFCPHCGQEFVGRVRRVQLRRLAGEDVRQGKNIGPRPPKPEAPKREPQKPGPKPGRKNQAFPKVDPAASIDAERQLLALAAAQQALPHAPAEDPRFYAKVTPTGMLLCWPTFDIRFELTVKERGVVLGAKA